MFRPICGKAEVSSLDMYPRPAPTTPPQAGVDVLDSLEESPYRDNTIVVLLGENASGDDRRAYKRLHQQLVPLMEKQGWWTRARNGLAHD